MNTKPYSEVEREAWSEYKREILGPPRLQPGSPEHDAAWQRFEAAINRAVADDHKGAILSALAR